MSGRADAIEERGRGADHARPRFEAGQHRPIELDPGVDFDRPGRIDVAPIEEVAGEIDAAYDLCGPLAFVSGLTEDLRRRGVAEDRIHVESFGSAIGA